MQIFLLSRTHLTPPCIFKIRRTNHKIFANRCSHRYRLKSTLAVAPKLPFRRVTRGSPVDYCKKTITVEELRQDLELQKVNNPNVSNQLDFSSFVASESKQKSTAAVELKANEDGFGRKNLNSMGPQRTRKSCYVPIKPRSDAVFGSSQEGRGAFLGPSGRKQNIKISGCNEVSYFFLYKNFVDSFLLSRRLNKRTKAPGPGGYKPPRSDFDFIEQKRLTEAVIGFASSGKRCESSLICSILISSLLYLKFSGRVCRECAPLTQPQALESTT